MAIKEHPGSQYKYTVIDRNYEVVPEEVYLTKRFNPDNNYQISRVYDDDGVKNLVGRSPFSGKELVKLVEIIHKSEYGPLPCRAINAEK